MKLTAASRSGVQGSPNSSMGSRQSDRRLRLKSTFSEENDVTLYRGDCLTLLRAMPSGCADLVVTSPPYNIGKEYEDRLNIDEYLVQQARVISECARVLSHRGSLCWQVGNHVDKGRIIPLDTVLFPIFDHLGLIMRNRIIWHFEHGLHCARRFSGRYEVVMWFTRSSDYIFNLDPVRVPQKYPGKLHFKGPRAGQPSCNPLGKNPSDLWIIPNVKHNHVEKTEHPCQFPVELIERLLLSMTEPGSLVVDPFMGVGTSAVAAILHGRRVAGADIVAKYVEIAEARVRLAWAGSLRTRPLGKPVYTPSGRERVAMRPPSRTDGIQFALADTQP